jgi:hypothetical protein
MSFWISEKDYQQGGGEAAGIAINVPFMLEIKQDFEFRELLSEVSRQIHATPSPSPRESAEMLGCLRDQLETYFALEEFYGYFKNSNETTPRLSRQAEKLKQEHTRLYLQLQEIVEQSERILYQESIPGIHSGQLPGLLDQFRAALESHEQQEMDLMMRSCNLDLGVGD